MNLRRPRRAADRLIVALDFTSMAPALAMARRLRGVVRIVKVGSALFTAAGPQALQRLRALGFDIMLDLKFFDIPNTVELSCRAATHLRAALVTVHAQGGALMLAAAVRGVRAEARRYGLPRPRVLAVTVLTSVEGRRQTGRDVIRRARAALEGQCDGVVASAQEAAGLRRTFGNQLAIVCPGIRPAAAARADQRRVGTPAQALSAGADALVIGRPITAASDPRAAAQRVLDEMEAATGF